MVKVTETYQMSVRVRGSQFICNVLKSLEFYLPVIQNKVHLNANSNYHSLAMLMLAVLKYLFMCINIMHAWHVFLELEII